MTDGENEGDDCDAVICAEVNQEESEHNEVDGMKKGAGITGTFVPSTIGTWNFRSLELSFRGTFTSESENDVELLLPKANKKPSCRYDS